MARSSYEIEMQIVVLRGRASVLSNYDNDKHKKQQWYAIQGKIKQLEKLLSKAKSFEFLAQ